MRIHNEVGRFQCVFPRSYCKHRSGKFNRPYDYKKHLLNMHFSFDDPSTKTLANLTEKLGVHGLCMACGQKYVASAWLEQHVLTNDSTYKCPELLRLEAQAREEAKKGLKDGVKQEGPEIPSLGVKIELISSLHEDRLLEELQGAFLSEEYDDSN